MKKGTIVRVNCFDSELEFYIDSNTRGSAMLTQVTKSLNIREYWYFGLKYDDTKGFESWLKLDKRVVKHNLKKEPVIQLRFRAKYYPESVADDIIQSTTLRLFYLQVKEAIIEDEVFTAADHAVMLASYAMQARHGDFQAGVHELGFLQNERMLPQRILAQYELSLAEWEKRIMDWWVGHKGQSRDTAMLEYLKLAQDLDMYGVSYFDVRNKKGTDLWLGVDALGLNFYEKDNKLTPKIGFPWSEIRNISFDDRKFTIKPVEKKAPNFIFYTQHLRINKTIFDLCMGNHEMYVRRRQPESIEVQEMRKEAEEDRQLREAEHERLRREQQAREQAEQKQKEYEAAMAKMQQDVEATHRELEQAQAQIHHLQEELFELNEAKRELERRERELQALTDRLQSERIMSLDERQMLMEQIEQQKSQVEQWRTQVTVRTHEADKLQREVDARRQNATNGIIQINGDGSWNSSNIGNGTRSNGHNSSYHSDDDDDLTKVHEKELSRGDGSELPQHELERRPTVDRNVNIRTKLDMLTRDLDAYKDTKKMTTFDALHNANRQVGRDKYKTLRQIRSGNTKRRIDQYENM